MSIATEYIDLSSARTAKIEWWVKYANGKELAATLLNANNPEALLHGKGYVHSILIIAEKYHRRACELTPNDAVLLGAAIARIASITETMRAVDWEF